MRSFVFNEMFFLKGF